MQKTAISIFNPQTQPEMLFADVYHQATGNWMTAGEMHEVMRALPTYRALSQKVKREPAETAKLLFGKVNDADVWYYPCDIVDLRVILAEKQISWHAPIILFGPQAAQKLMSQYPICLVLDRNIVKTGRSLGGVTLMHGNRLQLGKSLRRIMVRTYLGERETKAITRIIKDTAGYVPIYVMHDLPGVASKAASHEPRTPMNWYEQIYKTAKGLNETYEQPFLVGELPKKPEDMEDVEVMSYVPEHERLKKLYPPGPGYVFRYTQVDLNKGGGQGAKTKYVPVTRSLLSQPTKIEITRIDERHIHFTIDGSPEEQKVALEAYIFINRPLN